jgi:hypothetical protein
MKDETIHAVEMTRAIRNAIYEETKDLGTEDLILYFKEKARLATPPTDLRKREARRSKS